MYKDYQPERLIVMQWPSSRSGYRKTRSMYGRPEQAAAKARTCRTTNINGGSLHTCMHVNQKEIN